MTNMLHKALTDTFHYAYQHYASVYHNSKRRKLGRVQLVILTADFQHWQEDC